MQQQNAGAIAVETQIMQQPAIAFGIHSVAVVNARDLQAIHLYPFIVEHANAGAQQSAANQAQKQ